MSFVQAEQNISEKTQLFIWLFLLLHSCPTTLLMKLRFGRTADLNMERKTIKFKTHLHIFELLHLANIFIHFYTMTSFSIRAIYVYTAHLGDMLLLTKPLSIKVMSEFISSILNHFKTQKYAAFNLIVSI